jgi:hypothetical protein
MIASIDLELKKVISVKELRLVRSPNPICPRALAPAAQTLPPLSNKKVVLPPENIFVMPVDGAGIKTGMVRCI